MIARALRLILGLLLIPVSIGYALSFSDQLMAVRQVGASEHVFLLGITAYLAFHAMVAAPTRLYVFGHELMHAAAAWIAGGKVFGFKVGQQGGSVLTDKINAFTSLAPYLVPVYAILWVLLYGLAGLFWNVASWTWVLFFGLGVTLTFHLVFTVNVLKQHQPDLEVMGPVLGLVLIILVNMALVLGTMSLLIPEVRFGSYFLGGLRYTQNIYQTIFAQLFGA